MSKEYVLYFLIYVNDLVLTFFFLKRGKNKIKHNQIEK